MKRIAVIFLALAMAGLAACAPPTPPPLPTPPAELTVYEAEAEALRALGDPASSGLLDQRHAWPLICTTDGDYDPRESNMAHLAAVASHHCTMWTFNWPDYYKNAAATVKNPFTVLRGLNPAIAVIGVTHSYLIPWSACESPAFPATCAIWRAVDGNDWYAYNGDGERIPSATGTWINWTAGYSQWLADFVAGQAARKCDDGKPCYQGFYIEVAGIPHGISNFFTADLDRDGQQDMRPGPGGMTKCELDAKQIKGYTDFAQAVSRSTGLPGGGENFGPGLAGPDSPNPLLGKVTMYFDGEFPFGAWPDCTRDPYGGSGGYTTLGDAWGMHLRSAFAFQDAGVPGVLYRQDDWTLPSSENQTRRLVMATAAMTDMYAVPHESQLPEQMPCDECLVNAAGFTTGDPANLGWAGKPRGGPFRPRDGATMRQAIARGERLSDDVWVRFFDGAFVAVNPTERAQIVNIPAGFAAVNAATRPAGDWAVNNGRPVTRLELAPKDGRILRRLPVPLPTATASPGARPTVTPTMTASPGARPTATPTMTVRPTATPTATATPSELERLKLRVSALETAVAGGR